MSALAASTVRRYKKFSNIELAGKTEQVYKNGLACFDVSTGLVAKGFVSVNLKPIGWYSEDKNIGAGGTIVVELFKEITAVWLKNDGTVVAGTVGNLCYVLDDITVSNTDNSNTRSVAGRVWAIDTTLGVLVEMSGTDGDRLGGLDA